MDDELWTLERIERERAELAPLARLHRALAEETLAFATDGSGPAARPAFAGPPALHWLAGRTLLAAARRDVLRGLVAPLTRRLALRVGAEFPPVAGPAAEIADAAARDDFPWDELLDDPAAELSHGALPHAPLLRFLFLRALAAPAAHLARAFSGPGPGRWTRPACPWCGLPPAAAVAQAGADRLLLCVLCGGRWTRPGMACPQCDEDRADRLRVLAGRDAGPAALEACDTCGTAVKVFHDGALEPGPPLALELLTLRLDVVAERDEGVRRAGAALAALFPPD